MFLRERRDDENTVGPHTADARATDGRLACRPRHAPMRPRRMGLRRSDGTPCPGHPLDPSKSDRYVGRFPGSRVVAPVTPSQPGRTPMPVAACPFVGQACVRHSPLTVAGTAADSKHRFPPHSHLRPCRAPTRSDGPVEPGLSPRLPAQRRLANRRKRPDPSACAPDPRLRQLPVDGTDRRASLSYINDSHAVSGDA